MNFCLDTNMEFIRILNMTFKIRRAGRKPVLEHKRREPCHSIRIQNWLLFWLKTQNKIGGRLIEQALIKTYKLSENEIKEEFYKYIKEGEKNV